MKKGLLQQLDKDNEKTRKIVVIRHGQTALNKDKRIRGWSDVPLDDTGKQQVQKLGKELKGSGIDMLIASDLTRTLQTAQEVSRESGIPLVKTTIELRPWNVGKYTAHPVDEVHPMLLKLAMEEPEKNIEDGESFCSFQHRVLLGLVANLNANPGKLIGFVCHHRNDRLIRGWYEAGCPSDLEIDFDHFLQHGIEPGTADVLEITSDLLV